MMTAEGAGGGASEWTADSLTVRVGVRPARDLQRCSMRGPMLSLDNAFSYDAFARMGPARAEGSAQKKLSILRSTNSTG